MKKHVCVVDMDPQATAAAWGDWRGGEFAPEVITCPPARLKRTLDKADKVGADFIVIDTPPHADAAAREAIKYADLVLIPTRPRAFDLHALEATAELISFVGGEGYVILNAVPAGATLLTSNARQFAEDLGLEVCPVSFGDRAAFHRSSGGGEVAAELEPEGKAAGEVAALWQWVREQL